MEEGFAMMARVRMLVIVGIFLAVQVGAGWCRREAIAPLRSQERELAMVGIGWEFLGDPGTEWSRS